MKRFNPSNDEIVPTKNQFHIANRGQIELNSIRRMLGLTKQIDLERRKQGLEPLINLGIGAPHIPSNPIMDLAVQAWTNKKFCLRQQINELEQKLQQGKNPEIEKELFTKKTKLVNIDTYQTAQVTKFCQPAANLINHFYPFLNVEARHCCITNGASQALFVLFQAFVEPGVTVAAFAPFFPPYKKSVESLGGSWVSIPSLDNCRPSIENLSSALSTHNISILLLNDPCNPTGIKMTSQELTDIGKVLSKPENKGIVIIADETYHDLIYSENKQLFLDVVEKEEFKSRTCLVFSMSKSLAGCPGLRLGIAYAPDMIVNGNLQQIGIILGNLMTDTTVAVCTLVQYVGKEIIKAKLGKSTPERFKIHSQWEAEIYQIYSSMIKMGVSIFTEDFGLPLVVEPAGAFFGFISGKKLIGKKIPEKIKLLDGREVLDIPSKVESSVFATDIHISIFLLCASEVVTIPASGFSYDPTRGCLRISFAVPEEHLREAGRRIKNAIDQVI